MKKAANRTSHYFVVAVALLDCAATKVEGFAKPVPQIMKQPKVTTQPSALMMSLTTSDKASELSSLVAPFAEMETQAKKSMNPTPVLVSAWQSLVRSDGSKENGMKLAAAAMAFALAFLPLSNAEAAMSGGRMGGSFSAPRQSISRPAPSSFNSGYSRGFSSGYMSRPGLTISPGIGYGYGYSPFMSPFSPFSPFRGVYGGPGVIAVSRGPSFFDLLFFGGFMFAVAQIFLGSARSASSTTLDWSSSASSALGSGTSVVQLSVALEVPDRDDPQSILGVLNRLSGTARTDSRVGIQNLSSQVALELLRRRSSIVSASSSTKHFGDRNKAFQEFQSRSVKERSKFESEVVNKYGGVDYAGGRGSTSVGNGKATLAVITLLLAIDGDSTKLPRINSVADVEEALRRIASDSKVDDCLQSAEILWTPEDRSETLSLRDVVADYPELRSV